MDQGFAYPGGCLPLPEWMASPPIPEGVRSILVYGGSFDPPHIGHRRLGLLAREGAGLDWLLVIPAAQSPHKEDPPRFSGEQRLGFLGAMFEGDERVSVSRMEIERQLKRPDEPSYTVDTLHTLRGFLPLGVKMRLLIGADQALSLHRWLEPMAVMALAEPVVMRRDNSGESRGQLAERIAANWDRSAEGVSAADWEKRIVEMPLIDASSTEVRRLLDEPETDRREARLRELLHPAVYARVKTILSDR